MKYKLWNRKDDILCPGGTRYTAEEAMVNWPYAAFPEIKCVIADLTMNGAVFSDFEMFKEAYVRVGAVFTDEMSDQEVLDAITAFELRPPENPITAEERIAAALELSNLINMP